MDVELLKRTMKYHGWTKASLAKELGMHRDTLQRRMRKENFRIDEVQKIKDTIPLSEEEANSIFFNKK